MMNDECRMPNLMKSIQDHTDPESIAFRHGIFVRHLLRVAHPSGAACSWLSRFARLSFVIRHLLLALLLAYPVHALELPTAKPATGAIHRWVALPSTLAPWQQATLHAKVTGYIKKISVDKGDAVKAGRVIAEIEVPELETDLVRYEAELVALKPVFDFAKLEFERLTVARKNSSDLILPQMVDKAKSDFEKAKADFDIAEANAKRARVMLGYAKIVAPFDGIITARHVDAGALVNSGTSKVVEIVDASTIRLQIPVTELETALVQAGKPVKAAIDAIGSKPVEAVISRVAYALDPATRTMLAEADLKNADLKLHPGMYAMAKIAVERHDNAMLIPVAGLVMEKTNAFAFRHIGGKAVKTPITIGFNDGTNVEVLSGLDKDAVVLLPDKVTLTPDQPVTVK